MKNPSREYLKKLSVADRRLLADTTKRFLPHRRTLNPKTLWFIGEGKRNPSEELQVALEAASNGRVRAEDFVQEVRDKLHQRLESLQSIKAE